MHKTGFQSLCGCKIDVIYRFWTPVAEGLAVMKCTVRYILWLPHSFSGLTYLGRIDSTVEEHIWLAAESFKTLLLS